MTQELVVRSSLDGSLETSLFARHPGADPAPLVVCLHTWSADRTNQVAVALPYAGNLGWHILFPEFRGPNLVSNPRARQACASPLAKQDIVDAVDHVIRNYPVDANRIFLIGGSGGGHMALMMAGYRPDLWNTVYAGCGITDLAAWHSQNPRYAPHIEACFGGPPDSPERIADYQSRSPLYCADRIAAARVYISHGRYDRSVPFTHGLNLYNRISELAPASQVFLDIFDGGHELHNDAAFALFARQGTVNKENVPLTG